MYLMLLNPKSVDHLNRQGRRAQIWKTDNTILLEKTIFGFGKFPELLITNNDHVAGRVGYFITFQSNYFDMFDSNGQVYFVKQQEHIMIPKLW